MNNFIASTFVGTWQKATFESARLVQDWKTFFWKPVDGSTLGIIRALTGSMLLYNLLVWSLRLQAFFASDGLQPLETVRRFYEQSFAYSFWFYVPDQYLMTVHWLCVAIVAMFCVGWQTRITSVLAYVITISYSQRVPVANFGLDQILGMLCLYCAIGPSGLCFSVDRWLQEKKHSRRKTPIPARSSSNVQLSLRLIQIHMCVIYFWAGVAKLKGESWWTGDAMWRVMANQEYQTTDLTWTAWVPWVPYVAAHATVLWEIFFCVLVWNKRLRPLVLLIGTGMHFGIGMFLGMWTFGLIMTYAYFAFSDPITWKRRLAGLFGNQPDHSEAPSSKDLRSRIQPLQTPSSGSLKRLRSVKPIRLRDHVLLLVQQPEVGKAIRAYLKKHDIPALDVRQTEDVESHLKNSKPAVVVILGDHFPTVDIQSLAEKLHHTPIKTLFALTEQQRTELQSLDAIERSMTYPTTMRTLREELTAIMFGSEQAIDDTAQQRPSDDRISSS